MIATRPSARRRHAEEGAATVEFALLLPILLIAAVAFVPLIVRMNDAVRLDEAMGQTVRYATKASAAARPAPAECAADGVLTRRRSGTEVATFLAAASGGRIDPADVTITVTQPDGSTTNHPCLAIAGSDVEVRAVVDPGVSAADELSRSVRNLLPRNQPAPAIGTDSIVIGSGILE